MADYLIPLTLLLLSVLALRRREPVYQLLLEGSREGLQTLFSIVPALIILMTAVSMLRASGAADLLSRLLAPGLVRLGIPPETVILLLVRPVSGSAALAVGADLMAVYGVDSRIGRTAAVMLGSSETTFYAISVYCGSVGVEKTRYTVPAALIADCAGFLSAAWCVRLL